LKNNSVRIGLNQTIIPMGAKQADISDPRQRQLAREGIRMRQENIRRQETAPQTGAASMYPGVEPGTAPAPARAGIEFGPGRANRFPEPGSPEYQMAIARMRQGKR
jgi:hypothetical protein